MKQMKLWLLAAILVCGATAGLTACASNDDNPAPQTDIAEKIIGKWLVAELDGQPTPTNQKYVLTFLSSTKALFSQSAKETTAWNQHLACDVAIKDNIVSVSAVANGMDFVGKYMIHSISDSKMDTDYAFSYSVGGNIVGSDEGSQNFLRITNDYSQDILGTWEGKVTSAEGSEYDDGELHRWEYKADGTYVYYNKAGDEWVDNNEVFANYFVDGTLLCTRWKNAGEGEEEHREWWEIESIKDGVMKWTALRQREDGTTYTATFQMTKVK